MWHGPGVHSDLAGHRRGGLASDGGSGLLMVPAPMNGMMSQADLDALDTASGADSPKRSAQQMTPHHQGAIDMANEELSSGKDADALALAKKIVAAQTAETATMKDLLAPI